MKSHEDKRRTLYEYKYPITKILDIHEDCIVGNHYHKLRKEVFILVSGYGTAVIGGQSFPMTKFESIEVSEEQLHEFHLIGGSVLLEFANKEYDPTDDYKS